MPKKKTTQETEVMTNADEITKGLAEIDLKEEKIPIVVTSGYVEPVDRKEDGPLKVRVIQRVQAYSRPNLNTMTAAGQFNPGIYEVTDMVGTRQGRFLRIRGGKYILEGPYTTLQ